MKTRIAALALTLLGAATASLALGCDKASPPPPAPATATTTNAATGAPAARGAADTDPMVGQPAPDFTATAQDGSAVHLSALKGKPVVLYFYPQDETPGCTKEACSFRDSWDALGKTGAILVGVSADSLESHKAFVAHYTLPFVLISDPDGAIAKKFGVPFAGHHDRQTVVIGADGNVKKIYRRVNVTSHASQVLGDLQG